MPTESCGTAPVPLLSAAFLQKRMMEKPEAAPKVKSAERRPAKQCHSQEDEKKIIIMAVIFPKQDKELNLFCILSGANAAVETSQAALGRGGRRAASDFFRTQAQK